MNDVWQAMQWFDTEPKAIEALSKLIGELETSGECFDSNNVYELLETHYPLDVADNDIDTLIDDFNERLTLFH